jgi:DNA-binding transcriptional MerR regulator
MLIGELASLLGVTPKALRHYERIGLVPRAERTGNGYRDYSSKAVRRARLIVDLRSLGLSIETIQKLLVADSQSLRKRLLGVLDQQINEHALQISVLQGRHDDLVARYHALLTQPSSAPADCICGALMRRCDCATMAPAMPQKDKRRRAKQKRP